MLSSIAFQLATKLAKASDRNDVDDLRYGIEVTLSVLLKIIFFLAISSLFGVTSKMFIVAFSFAFFRIFSGGVHLSTFLRCLISSTFLFLVPSILVHDSWNPTSTILLLLITFVIGIVITIIYVPISAANRPIPIDKKQTFKWKSIAFLSFWFSLNLYFYFQSQLVFSIYSSIGILIQAFTLTQPGSNTLRMIDSVSEKIMGGGKIR